MKLLFVGYATVDIIQGSLHPGGAAAIMAINASQLGHNSSLLTVLSQDKMGTYFQSVLKKYSVDFSQSYLESPSIPTCTIVKPHDLGSKRVWVDNGANKYMKSLIFSSAYLDQFDGIFVANCHPDLAEQVALHSTQPILYIPGPQVVLKSNYIRKTVIEKSKIIFGNEEEAPHILKQKPLENGAELVVITRGKNGGAIYTADGNLSLYSASTVQKAIDPTGAGDAFALGFGTHYLKNKNINQAINTAKKLSSRVLVKRGAIL